MIEITTFRKNKIELSDYDFKRDIDNRVLMSTFTSLDVQTLEEILYSSLVIPITHLAEAVELKPHHLVPILDKLKQTKLFKIVGDEIHVDKEMRKYYEFQILKFDPDFKPGMDFLQGLLRKVPIHVLPNWYAIPRSSNNIFDSLIEKYLRTPQVYQRYLLDLTLSDPIQKQIIECVHQANNFEIEAASLIKELGLTQEKLEEHLLYLEYSFVCCVSYKKVDEHWKEMITPFWEWKEYLNKIRLSVPEPVENQKKVTRIKKENFAFIKEMTAILEATCHSPLAISRTTEELITFDDKTFQELKKCCPEISKADIHHLVSKLCRLKWADALGEKLYALDGGHEWLALDLKERAISLYRHPLNGLEREDFSKELLSDRALREAEKSIARLPERNWVTFDEFFKALAIPLREEQAISLQKCGRTWRYRLPQYTDEELDFFKAVISQWLFEVGMIALGEIDDSPCFCVTPLGQELFGNE